MHPRLILVKFSNDTIVQPRDTQWFAFYEPGQDVKIVPLQSSTMYTEDRLGLREMEARGQLAFVESPGNHLQFTEPWFEEHILPVLAESDIAPV